RAPLLLILSHVDDFSVLRQLIGGNRGWEHNTPKPFATFSLSMCFAYKAHRRSGCVPARAELELQKARPCRRRRVVHRDGGDPWGRALCIGFGDSAKPLELAVMAIENRSP